MALGAWGLPLLHGQGTVSNEVAYIANVAQFIGRFVEGRG
jgi:hypothetical protein